MEGRGRIVTCVHVSYCTRAAPKDGREERKSKNKHIKEAATVNACTVQPGDSEEDVLRRTFERRQEREEEERAVKTVSSAVSWRSELGKTKEKSSERKRSEVREDWTASLHEFGLVYVAVTTSLWPIYTQMLTH